MHKINKLLKALCAIVRQPNLLNLVIDDAAQWQNTHQQKYPQLPQLPVMPFEHLIPQDLSIRTCFLDGGSMPTDIALLKALALRLGAGAAYFEIGTWRGESVSNVADVLTDCSTLNLSAAEMKQMGWPVKYAQLHGILSKSNPNIKHLEGNTLTFDFAALGKKYDLIFIDGDHSHAMVKHDTQQVWQHLRHEKSIVVWHDYAFNPEKVRHEVFHAILEAVPAHQHQHLYHVENSMCAIFWPQEVPSQSFESPCAPSHYFELKLHKIDLKKA